MLITGLLVFLPLIVLVLVLQFVFNAVEALAVLVFGITRSVNGAAAVFLITLTVVMYAGHKVRRREKWFLNRLEKLLGALPVVGSWYQTLKDLVEVLAGSSPKYLGVVKVPFGAAHVLGFITRREADPGGGPDKLTVFVPTSPNPTSGIVMFFTADNVEITDIPPESAFSRIISLGLKS